MASKGNLLKEVYNLRNQIAEVKGNDIVNINELLGRIKNALFYYAERIASIQKEVRELDELVKNQTNA